MNRPTWDSAKHLLAEFDGAATEIFVTGLPFSRLQEVVAVLAELPALEVTAFDDEALEDSEPFDSKWRSRFASTPSSVCFRNLRSAAGTARHLQVHLWGDVTTGLLEVELVFWNDLTFPQGLVASEREQRLDTLLSLAEACRRDVPDARCLLTSEHNGPIEELLEDRSVVVW